MYGKHFQAYSGTLSRPKSPAKVALSRLKSPLSCNAINAKIPLEMAQKE